MMDDFDTIPVDDTERTEDTDTDASPPPFVAEPKERTPAMRRLESQLAEVYAAVGTYGGMALGQRGVLAGTVVAGNADVLAGAWVDLAERDARVKRALENFVQAGGWAGVIGAHVTVIMPILAIYGILPDHVAAMVWTGVMAMNPTLYGALQSQSATMNSSQNGDDSAA